MKWMPSFDLVAQLGHTGWGALITLGFAYFGHPFWGVAGTLAWSLPKEFVFDKFVEGQTFADNLRDFVHYIYGMGGALTLVLIHHFYK